MVNKFDVTSTQNVPLRVGLKLDEFDVDEETDSSPFRELVGGLMWLAISTRPDISNAVRSVARYCSTPKAIHWKAVLDILAYINGTSDFGITYQGGTLASIYLEVLATQLTPVKQPTGDLCLVEPLCADEHVYVGFLGRRNVSHL